MKKILGGFCLALLIIQQALSQLTVTIETDKTEYDYGDPIIVTGTISNPADTTTSVILHNGHFFYVHYFNEILLDMAVLPVGVSYDFPPRSTHTTVYKLDPHRLGLPNSDGQHKIVYEFLWGDETNLIRKQDTIVVSAPAYEGGQLLVTYSVQVDQSGIEALRDSMNATVITSDTIGALNSVAERWQTTGFIVDSLVAKYEWGYNLLSIYADRTVFPDTMFITKVNEPAGYISGYTLEQNYPNPFNPSTTIAYDLPGRFAIQLTIFNVVGQEIATLVDDIQERGRYEISWDASGLPSGVYYYRLRGDDFIETKRMVLIR